MNDSQLSLPNTDNDGYERGFIITQSILWDNMCLSIIHDKYFFVKKKSPMSMAAGLHKQALSVAEHRAITKKKRHKAGMNYRKSQRQLLVVA
jgi:hypothetical protein